MNHGRKDWITAPSIIPYATQYIDLDRRSEDGYLCIGRSANLKNVNEQSTAIGLQSIPLPGCLITDWAIATKL